MTYIAINLGAKTSEVLGSLYVTLVGTKGTSEKQQMGGKGWERRINSRELRERKGLIQAGLLTKKCCLQNLSNTHNRNNISRETTFLSTVFACTNKKTFDFSRMRFVMMWFGTCRFRDDQLAAKRHLEQLKNRLLMKNGFRVCLLLKIRCSNLKSD